MVKKQNNESNSTSEYLDGVGSSGVKEDIVKKLIEKGKSRGFLTYDELNDVLSPENFSSEKIEDINTMISDMGISLVDSDEEFQENETKTEEKDTLVNAAPQTVSETELGRTDDPVRMYLREMGNV